MPRLIVVGCRVKGAHGPFIQTNDPVQGSTLAEGRQRRPRRKRLVILGTVIAHLGDIWVLRWDDDAVSITDYRGHVVGCCDRRPMGPFWPTQNCTEQMPKTDE